MRRIGGATRSYAYLIGGVSPGRSGEVAVLDEPVETVLKGATGRVGQFWLREKIALDNAGRGPYRLVECQVKAG